MRIGTTDLEIAQGDLTLRAEEAIVNAANEHLQHGGGVAGAIVRRGGAAIQKESDAIGHCPVGGAVITFGGALAARHVIHAVGPRWGEGSEAAKLASAITSSLALAEARGLGSIAFPAISTGIFGYPLSEAASVMLGACVGHLRKGSALSRVVFCLFDASTARVFEDTLKGLKA
jgi:O-acetyl-ADP-ribose deacetylase (regulator of RNase III)